MSLFRKKKQATSEPAAPDQSAPAFTFERQYINSPTFRGYKRMYVTIFNDGYDDSEANAIALLNGAEIANCNGRMITLKGIKGPGYRGIGVYIDPEQHPVGTIWERGVDTVFTSLYNGHVTDVFLRIEASNPRPVVYLFAKMPQ